MNCTSTVYENRLRQRIVMLEDSLARVALTRKELKDSVDVVKNEVRVSFGHQLNRLRNREQQLLEKLDTVASVKDNILSKQQDHLHLALGACTQGLQWLQTAFEDLKTDKLTSLESVERRIGDILNNYASVDFMPRETSHVSFESDSAAMRRAIAAYGQIRTSSLFRNSESLPCALEDYEDENHSHALSHKSVHGPTRTVNMLSFRKPVIPSDTKEWLLKEALTSSDIHAVEKENHFAANPLDSKRSSISCESMCHTPRSHHTQIHNWLYQMKTAVENEPTVFEDFDISKKLNERKNTQEFCETSKEAMFKKHFEQIIRSPDQGWLIDAGSVKNVVHPVEMNANALSKAIDIFQRQQSAEDMKSGASSFTISNNSFCIVNSIGSCAPSIGDNIKTNDGLETDVFMQYSDYWNRFLENLRSSSDSMWLLPCASNDEHPVMLKPPSQQGTLTNCGDDLWTPENEMSEIVSMDGEITTVDNNASDTRKEHDQMISDRVCPDYGFLPKNFTASRREMDPGDVNFSKLDLNNTFPTDADRQMWLWKPKPVEKGKTELFSTVFNQCMDEIAPRFVPQNPNTKPPSNECEPLSQAFEAALGWKAVLEKVHGLGDEKWLLKSQVQQPIIDLESEMQMYGYPLTDF